MIIKNENYFINLQVFLNSIFKNYEGKLPPSYINLKVDVLVRNVCTNKYLLLYSCCRVVSCHSLLVCN